MRPKQLDKKVREAQKNPTPEILNKTLQCILISFMCFTELKKLPKTIIKKKTYYWQNPTFLPIDKNTFC